MYNHGSFFLQAAPNLHNHAHVYIGCRTPAGSSRGGRAARHRDGGPKGPGKRTAGAGGGGPFVSHRGCAIRRQSCARDTRYKYFLLPELFTVNARLFFFLLASFGTFRAFTGFFFCILTFSTPCRATPIAVSSHQRSENPAPQALQPLPWCC